MFAILSWKMTETTKYQQDNWQPISFDQLIDLSLQLKCADNWTYNVIEPKLWALVLLQSSKCQNPDP